jgi:hypothetical protein
MKQVPVVDEKKAIGPFTKNQCYGSGLIDSGSGSGISGWIPIRIRIRIGIQIHGFDDQQWEKIYSWKNLIFFLPKIAIYLSLGLHKERQATEEAFSPHPALQTMRFLNFFYSCGPFLPSWVQIPYPELDPNPEPYTYQIRIRIQWPDWNRIQSESGTLRKITYSYFQLKSNLKKMVKGKNRKYLRHPPVVHSCRLPALSALRSKLSLQPQCPPKNKKSKKPCGDKLF